MFKLVITVAFIGIVLYYTKGFLSGCVCDNKTRLDGKTVVITGANTGIGLETVKMLLNRGANVVATARDQDKCQSTIQHVKEKEGEKAVSKLKCVLLDLADKESIEACAQEILSTTNQIHVLINNAGVMAIPNYMQTKQGFEMQFGVNHLGHFLLTHLLTSRLIESQPSRVVIVSSSGHRLTNGLRNLSALNDPEAYGVWYSYADSKAANVLHAQELGRRLKSKGVSAVSLHPGAIASDLGRNMALVFKKLIKIGQYLFLKTPWEGAQTTLHCVLDDSVVENTGAYYSDCGVKAPINLAVNDERGPLLWKFSEDFWGIKSSY